MGRSLIARLHDRFDPGARLTRREVLKASLASAAALVLPSCAAGPDHGGRGAPRVCVLGAGFAGLACARELSAAGWDVTVVEARQRVGGRVLSRRDLVPGKTVEAGGELIGANHPLWLGYAREFGLSLADVTEEEGESPVRFEGKLLTPRQQQALWEEFEAALPLITAQADGVDAAAPWLTAGAEELDRRTASEAIGALEAGEAAKRELRRQLAGDNGVAVERQSWLANLAMVKGGGGAAYWTESESFRCRGGNQQLAQKLADAIGPGRVRLGVPAARVESGSAGVLVTLADRSRIEADRVVVAVPPAVWARIGFVPPLPPDLLPQAGSAVKYLAVVDGPFWRATGRTPDALTDGPVSETWNATDGQEDGGGSCLAAFSGGPAAEQCRGFGKEGRVEKYGEELGTLWPDYSRHFRRSLFMEWPADAWTGMGYSFPAPGELTALGARLREGFGRVQFAGEHMCPSFVGYMEGALRSGVDAARRVRQSAGSAR